MKTKIILIAILITIITMLTVIILVFGNKKPDVEKPLPQPTPRAVILPVKPSIKASQELESEKKYSVIYNLKTNRSFPKNITTISVSRNLSIQTIRNIQSSFQILSEPQQVNEHTYLWTLDGGSTSLLINTRSGYVEYNKSPYEAKSDPGGTQLKTVNAREAEKIAEKIIQDLRLTTITPGSSSLQTFKRPVGEIFEETTNPEEIELYQFTYQQSYKGLPIYQQLGAPAEIKIGVSNYGKITSLRLFSSLPTNSKEIQIIPVDQAQIKIQQNEGSIVRIENIQSSSISISSIIIDSIELGYLDDKTENSLIPIYVFEGIAETPFGEKGATIYLPAY